MRTLICLLAVLAVVATATPSSIVAQDESPPLPKLRSIEELEEQVLRLDKVDREAARAIARNDFWRDLALYFAIGAAVGFTFLTGVFCSVWAQDHGRNGALWFVLGMALNVLTLVLVLLLNPSKKDYSN